MPNASDERAIQPDAKDKQKARTLRKLGLHVLASDTRNEALQESKPVFCLSFWSPFLRLCLCSSSFAVSPLLLSLSSLGSVWLLFLFAICVPVGHGGVFSLASARVFSLHRLVYVRFSRLWPVLPVLSALPPHSTSLLPRSWPPCPSRLFFMTSSLAIEVSISRGAWPSGDNRAFPRKVYAKRTDGPPQSVVNYFVLIPFNITKTAGYSPESSTFGLFSCLVGCKHAVSHR